MRRSILVASLILLVAGPLAAAETHPFTIHDMLEMERIGDPPHGRLVECPADAVALAGCLRA